MKKWVLLIGVGVLVLALAYLIYAKFVKDDVVVNPQSASQQEPAGFDKQLYSIDEPGSPWWVVNKTRPLPEDYVPAEMRSPNMRLRWADDAESMQVSTQAVGDLEALNQAAKQAGIELMLVSAYRSASYQRQLYEGYVRSAGQEEADRFSARPGVSDHQTGLVVDLGRPDGECEIEECFADTKEGKWLAANAYKFGFILRYPEGKEDITGYLYEPWHFRWVGKELAAEIHQTKQTLEEFFGLPPAPDYP